MATGKYFFWILAVFCFLGCVHFNKPDSGGIICFTGDAMFGRSVAPKVRFDSSDRFSAQIREFTRQYAYSVVNLECPLTENGEPTQKDICLRCPPVTAYFMKKCGITHASVANNHIFDFGVKGYRETIKTLTGAGIFAIGNGSGEFTPQLIESGRKRIAIFAANLIIYADSIEKAELNFEKLVYAIQTYRLQHNADFVAVSVHWGKEYQTLANEIQQQQAREIIEAGADLIVGHHPHVVQNVAFIHHKPVFYSLGNFVFDQNQPATKNGILVGLDLNAERKASYKIRPFVLKNCFPARMDKLEKERCKQQILKNSKSINLQEDGGAWILTEKRLSGDEGRKNWPKMKEEVNDTSFALFAGGVSGKVKLVRLRETRAYRLTWLPDKHSKGDEVLFRFPVYRIDTGDINRDGRTDILLGVIKQTRFDPALKRRLFTLQIDNGQIRPLWLGSRVYRTLVDFCTMYKSGKVYVKTLEKDKNQLYCIGIYEWENFGLTLIQYNYEGLTIAVAQKLFKQ
jgi:hypothetical protein